ncbi:MAG: hypothetical protein HRU28_00575 [Rhizobiales bacterium]|nr:hypothetical protein [Hyphomicrobiales bacterium]
MMQYYRKNPQLNRDRAFKNYEIAKSLLRDFSSLAEKFEDFEDVWEKNVTLTAFSILYTIRRETIYVIDIRDQRGNRSADALRRFNSELRNKYGL